MTTLKRILVPSDGDELAEVARDCAESVALALGATCEVVTFRGGVPHEQIVRHASDTNVDLIVMGTHGRTGIAHAVLGSVTEKVLRSAPCPVLTVHRKDHKLVAGNILVAIDFDNESKQALAYGRLLGQAFGASLRLLHVMPNHFLHAMTADPIHLAARSHERMGEWLTDEDRRNLHATCVLAESDLPAEAILNYARTHEINLIVMGTHGRGAVDRFLLGSVAERVVRTAPCPVLTVRHAEHAITTVTAPVSAASR